MQTHTGNLMEVFCDPDRKYQNQIDERVLFNLLKPSGFFTCHQVQNSKIPHGARFALRVLYGYQNRQRLLLYTSLTDRCL
jgi:hypothetical protein